MLYILKKKIILVVLGILILISLFIFGKFWKVILRIWYVM